MKETNDSNNIIFYLKGYGNPGLGAESVGYKILKLLLSNTNYRLIVISDQKGKKIKDEILYKHKTFPLNIPFLNSIINNFFASRMIKKLSKFYSPKLIHVQGSANYYPTFSSNSQSLLTLHDDPSFRFCEKIFKDPFKFIEFIWFELKRFWIFRAIRKYDFFQAISLRILLYLVKLGISRNKIFLIHNGISDEGEKINIKMISQKEKILQNHKNIVILIIVGSIEYRKGTLNVAKSLKYLPNYFHLIIAGKPRPIIGMPYLKKIISIDQKRIHYLGYLKRKDLFSILDLSDIYISASLSEACQLSPLEAIMMKKKIVTTTAGAIPDFLLLNYPFLIKNNNPKEIAHLILKASNSKNIILMKDKVSVKSWDDIGKDLEDMYSKIISET